MAARRGRMELALGRSLRALTLLPEDEAATALATEYARGIDRDEDALWRLGPRLLDVLEALGMTPRARAAVLKGDTKPPEASPIDELRARRQKRAGA